MRRNARIILVGLPAATRLAVLPATQKTFAQVEVLEMDNVEAAERNFPGNRLDLLVLADPDSETAARAIQAESADGMPRWAVVILGRGPAELAEVVPPEEWQAAHLARVFRSAFLQHELLRENLRLRGDLRTTARRISHDLFTPLGCIGTSSQVLKLLPPNDPESLTDMIENIRVSTEEIFQLVSRTSFVLRASADPQFPAPVAMGEVVATVLKQLESTVKKSGGTIKQVVEWPAATGVPQWLHVIWCDLIANALRHGGPGAEVHVGWETADRERLFWVTDRGPGVAPEQQSTLFESFDRLHGAHKQGIGLSVVQRLVSLQGGRCGYERTNENLSRFYFTLPVGEAALSEKTNGHVAAAS